MLFADDAPGGDVRTIILNMVILAVGGAGTYLINLALKVRGEKRADKAADQLTIVQHLEALNKRLYEENEELGKDKESLHVEMLKLLQKLSACDIRGASMRAHIRYIEGVLARNKLSFERYDDDNGGSNSHQPLPEDSNKGQS